MTGEPDAADGIALVVEILAQPAHFLGRAGEAMRDQAADMGVFPLSGEEEGFSSGDGLGHRDQRVESREQVIGDQVQAVQANYNPALSGRGNGNENEEYCLLLPADARKLLNHFEYHECNIISLRSIGDKGIQITSELRDDAPGVQREGQAAAARTSRSSP